MSTTRYYSANYRLRARLSNVTRSPFIEDVRSRLHIIPEVVGALFAAYVLFGLIHLAAVAQALVTR